MVIRQAQREAYLSGMVPRLCAAVPAAMRSHDQAVSRMHELPRVIELTSLGAYRLRIEMQDRLLGVIDIEHEVQLPSFAALRDPRELAGSYIDPVGVVVWPSGAALDPNRLHQRLKLQQFVIGSEFEMSGARWRCTDVGTRMLAAIKLEHDDDPRLYNGPPYAVVETVIDEYDLDACTLTPLHQLQARERACTADGRPTRLDRSLLRRREEILEPVWFRYGPGGLKRVGRGARVIERAELEVIAQRDPLVASLLTGKPSLRAVTAQARRMMDEYAAMARTVRSGS
jgi:hypothetical protein